MAEMTGMAGILGGLGMTGLVWMEAGKDWGWMGDGVVMTRDTRVPVPFCIPRCAAKPALTNTPWLLPPSACSALGARRALGCGSASAAAARQRRRGGVASAADAPVHADAPAAPGLRHHIGQPCSLCGQLPTGLYYIFRTCRDVQGSGQRLLGLSPPAQWFDLAAGSDSDPDP